MKLLYSNCVPIMTYGCNVKELSGPDMTTCTVALNNAIRKIFSYKRWESVRTLHGMFHYDALEVVFMKAKTKFLKSLPSHENKILRFLATLS